MMSLLPVTVMKSLEKRFGSEFNDLSEEQKLALATVAIEGSVTHARIKEMSDIHPHDLSKALKDLVTRGISSNPKARQEQWCIHSRRIARRGGRYGSDPS